MKRRQFLKLVGGSALAAALPISVAKPQRAKPIAPHCYYVDLLIKICEGPAEVKRAWIGNKEIPLSDFKLVDGKTGMRALTGDDCNNFWNIDELPKYYCAMFENYRPPADYRLGNFTFEVVGINAGLIDAGLIYNLGDRCYRRQGEFIYIADRSEKILTPGWTGVGQIINNK